MIFILALAYLTIFLYKFNAFEMNVYTSLIYGILKIPDTKTQK